jgi:hypothetical protein
MGMVPKPIAKVGAWVGSELPTSKKPFIKPWMMDHAEIVSKLILAKLARSWAAAYGKMLPQNIAELKVDPKRWYQINKFHSSDSLTGQRESKPSLRF